MLDLRLRAGRGAELPGYDFLVQAMSGLMSITGPAGGEPTKVGVALVDVLTGLYAFGGVLAALGERERTGRGQRVEVSLLGSALASLVNQASSYLCTGRPPAAMGNRHPSIAPYETLATADRPLVVAVGNDGQFARLCRVLGLPEAAADPRFATNADRVTNREALVGLLEEALAARGADDWVAALAGAGVPCGLVNDVGEAFALAERLGLDPVADAGGIPQVANPIRLSGSPPPTGWPRPRRAHRRGAGLARHPVVGHAVGQLTVSADVSAGCRERLEHERWRPRAATRHVRDVFQGGGRQVSTAETGTMGSGPGGLHRRRVVLVAESAGLAAVLNQLLDPADRLSRLGSLRELAESRSLDTADVVVLDVPAEERAAAVGQIRRRYLGPLVILVTKGEPIAGLRLDDACGLLFRPFSAEELGEDPRRPGPAAGHGHGGARPDPALLEGPRRGRGGGGPGGGGRAPAAGHREARGGGPAARP